MRLSKGSARKACTAGLALVTALSMMPTAAFAANLESNTADITIDGVGSGDTVTAYEILDRNYDKPTNNVRDTFLEGTGYTLKQFQALKSDSDGMKTAADKIASLIKAGTAKPLSEKSLTAKNGSVTFKDAPTGEWLILVTNADKTVTKVYQNTIVSNAPEANATTGEYEAKDATATIKSSDETVKKGVGTNKQDAMDAKASDGQYGIGDTVPFVIDTIVPNYPVDATNKTFVVGDTPDAGLAIDQDSVHVYTVDASGTEGEVAKSNYSSKVEGGVLSVTFTDGYIKDNPGQEILVKYGAKVTSAAKVTKDRTTQNSASITFNPNPYEEGTSTPTSTTTVKTYGLFFVKKGDGKALEGAKFQIKYNSGEKSGQFVKDEKGNNLESTSDDKGYVWFDGLAKGDYTLVETYAPTGFQKVDDFPVKLDGSGSADNPHTQDVEEANFVQYNAEDGVVDPKVGLLPSTGDAGTIGLTAVGICLVAGSAFVIVSHDRRKRAED